MIFYSRLTTFFSPFSQFSLTFMWSLKLFSLGYYIFFAHLYRTRYTRVWPSQKVTRRAHTSRTGRLLKVFRHLKLRAPRYNRTGIYNNRFVTLALIRQSVIVTVRTYTYHMYVRVDGWCTFVVDPRPAYSRGFVKTVFRARMRAENTIDPGADNSKRSYSAWKKVSVFIY